MIESYGKAGIVQEAVKIFKHCPSFQFLGRNQKFGQCFLGLCGMRGTDITLRAYSPTPLRSFREPHPCWMITNDYLCVSPTDEHVRVQFGLFCIFSNFFFGSASHYVWRLLCMVDPFGFILCICFYINILLPLLCQKKKKKTQTS